MCVRVKVARVCGECNAMCVNTLHSFCRTVHTHSLTHLLTQAQAALSHLHPNSHSHTRHRLSSSSRTLTHGTHTHTAPGAPSRVPAQSPYTHSVTHALSLTHTHTRHRLSSLHTYNHTGHTLSHAQAHAQTSITPNLLRYLHLRSLRTTRHTHVS